MMALLFSARVLTAMVALALATLAVMAGINVVDFERDRLAGADLERWTSRALVGAPALDALLRRPEPDAIAPSLDRRLDLLTRSLAARPLAAQNWIALAALRHTLAMPPSQVDKAFMMSALTGPAEADAMAQRALVGVVLWETLAAPTRERALTDLCGLAVHDPSRLKLALSAKVTATRADIRQGLVAHACAPRMIAAVGL